MTSNNLSKEEQILKGQGTAQKGDWCEYMAAAHFRKEGYLVFQKMSGPIDFVLVHQDTGETRYVDIKYKNTRKTMKSNGKRINRSVNSRLGKILKKLIKIELIYVGEDCKLEQTYADGQKKWHQEFKIDKNSAGQYTGTVVKRKKNKND